MLSICQFIFDLLFFLLVYNSIRKCMFSNCLIAVMYVLHSQYSFSLLFEAVLCTCFVRVIQCGIGTKLLVILLTSYNFYFHITLLIGVVAYSFPPPLFLLENSPQPFAYHI